MTIVDLPPTGTDAAIAINAKKIYTHAFDFGAADGNPVTINGLTLDIGPTEDFTTHNGTSSWGYKYTIASHSETVKVHAGSAPTGQADGQSAALLTDMIHLPGGTLHLTLSDLTPQVTYSTRVYYRNWASSPRTITVQADGGHNGVFQNDTLEIAWDAGGAHYLDYRFKSDDTDVTINFLTNDHNNAVYLYALTNEPYTRWQKAHQYLRYDPGHTINDFSKVAHWTFDLASGAVDVVHGRKGTLHGDATWRPQSGQVGGCIELDGAGDYVEIAPQDNALDVRRITMSAWAKADNPGAGHQWIINRHMHSPGTYGLFLHEGKWKAQIRLDDRSTCIVQSNVDAPAGAWTHLQAAYDGEYLKLYVNGDLQENSEYAPGQIDCDNPGKLYIGSDNTLAGFFDGLIDDVQIHNDVSTHASVKLLGGCYTQYYDPSLAQDQNKNLWITYLEYVPNTVPKQLGLGDHIWVRRVDGAIAQRITTKPGAYAYPTLTLDNTGQMWLTYEAQNNPQEPWQIYSAKVSTQGTLIPGSLLQVSTATGNSINHRVAASRTPHSPGIWVAFQTNTYNQFDIVACFVDNASGPGSPHLISENASYGDWRPAIAVTSNGNVFVAWDSYRGPVNGYDVLGRWYHCAHWSNVFSIASKPNSEFRPDLACDSGDDMYVAWEEGPVNWGLEFRGEAGGDAQNGRFNNITDDRGPLHRFSRIRLAKVDLNSVRPFQTDMPMPAFDDPARKINQQSNTDSLGVFYERPRLICDVHDRLWVIYAHFYDLSIIKSRTTEYDLIASHYEKGWRVYARHLDGNAWSNPYALTENDHDTHAFHLRDGMQRLSAIPSANDISVAWTTGRTARPGTAEGGDYGAPDAYPERGIALVHANLTGNDANAAAPVLDESVPHEPNLADTRPAPQFCNVGEKTYYLYYGELHRHTDLSLCHAIRDGNLEDAYRYAQDAANLDFLAVTDHTRDLAGGVLAEDNNVNSQVWWRCAKEASRQLCHTGFLAFNANERSHDFDHNVISLRNDMLRPYEKNCNWDISLAHLFHECDANTFTIPHEPFWNSGIWKNVHDDPKRPLLEIYQGLRNSAYTHHPYWSAQVAANDGLSRGFHIGFIASNDHLATSSSYAALWWTPSEGTTNREAVFRAMQARRTYGATSRIGLALRCENHWMGEQFQACSLPLEFHLEIKPTHASTVTAVDVYVDCSQNSGPLKVLYPTSPSTTGWINMDFPVSADELNPSKTEHYVYVHVHQTDGDDDGQPEQAWSSPLWFTIAPLPGQ